MCTEVILTNEMIVLPLSSIIAEMLNMIDIEGFHKLPIEALYATGAKTVYTYVTGARDRCKNAMQQGNRPRCGFHEVIELVHSFLKNKRQPKGIVHNCDPSPRC